MQERTCKDEELGCKMQERSCKDQELGCKMQERSCKDEELGCKMQERSCKDQELGCKMQERSCKDEELGCKHRWNVLNEIQNPEMPAITTPSYSGCPAMKEDILSILLDSKAYIGNKRERIAVV